MAIRMPTRLRSASIVLLVAAATILAAIQLFRPPEKIPAKQTFPAPQHWGRYWNQQFPTVLATESSVDPATWARPRNQGMEILRLDFRPHATTTRLRVHVMVNAYSPVDNLLVVGVTRKNGSSGVRLSKTKLPAGLSSFYLNSYEFSNLHSTEEFGVRVGPAQRNAIFINGDGVGGRQMIGTGPFIAVEEIADPGIKPKLNATFPNDDGSYAFALSQNIPIPGAEPTVDGKKEIPCPIGTNLAGVPVFLVFGQSQAANGGTEKYVPNHEFVNFNFMNSKCYVATDPLLGATNFDGSIWSRLGDKIIESGAGRNVVVVPVAVGGTFLAEWMPGGLRHKRLLLALERVRRAGMQITGFIWQQGEAEAGFSDMSTDVYRAGFREIVRSIRERGFEAPVYVAISTHCKESTKRNSENIRRAQKLLPDAELDIRMGPDTDQIGDDLRPNQCHFNGAGQDRAADLWMRALALTRAATPRSSRDSGSTPR